MTAARLPTLLSLCFGSACALLWYSSARSEPVTAATKGAIVCPITEGTAAPLSLGRAVAGAAACVNCHLHGAASPAQVDPRVREIVGDDFFQRSTEDRWILANEWQVWSARDRHAQAYTTLLGERSVKMGEILGVKEIHRDARCVACHSGVPVTSMERDGNVLSPQYFSSDLSDRVTLGVSCEACHGAAGDGMEPARQGWLNEHVIGETWRHKSSVEKQSKFGYYDVRSPGSRARMCLSCHVGNAEEGKLVTHAMYAAGHPPLPAFEPESFASMMPPHWRRLFGGDSSQEPVLDPGAVRLNKSERLTRDFLRLTDDKYYRKLRDERPELFDKVLAEPQVLHERTRAVAVGALVAWSENTKVTLALMSDEEFPLLDDKQRWPEFAQFECYACHHELASPGWRREKQDAAGPGRPMLRDWSAPLSRAVLMALEMGGTEFDERLARIRAATNSQPYGDSEALREHLAEGEKWVRAKAVEVEARYFTHEEAVAVLRSIVAAGSKEAVDYDSARQLAWASLEILDDLDPGQQWDEARQAADFLRKQLALDPASEDVRQRKHVGVPGGSDRVAFEIELSAVLTYAAAHSAPAVRETFAKLGAAIDASLNRE
jgi:hypothetical protein